MSLRPSEPILAPSLLASDFTRLAEALRLLEAGGNCVVHVDVMDGRFVPNITIGLPVVAALRKETGLVLDCHLMIDHQAGSPCPVAGQAASGAGCHRLGHWRRFGFGRPRMRSTGPVRPRLGN